MVRGAPDFRRLLEESPILEVRDLIADRDCHLVGGALRDAALGTSSCDFDLVTSSGGSTLAALLTDRLQARLVELGGDRFALYRVVASNIVVDIWERRGSLLADLRRRDFTINAMALDLASGELVDPFAGLEDCRAGCLRAVDDDGFYADPLRILRAVRFVGELPGFTIEAGTLRAARDAAPGIDRVARERIRDELSRVLSTEDLAGALTLLHTAGLYPRLWRRQEASAGDDRAAVALLAAYSRLEPQVARAAGRPLSRLLCSHALLSCHLASDGRFEGVAASLGRRGLLSRSQTRRVVELTAAGPDALRLSDRRFLARFGHLWPEALAVAAARSGGSRLSARRLARLRQLVASGGEAVTAPRPLLDGREIQEALDLPPGPLIGRLLSELLEAQLDGTVRSRAEALRFLARAREATGD